MSRTSSGTGHNIQGDVNSGKESERFSVMLKIVCLRTAHSGPFALAHKPVVVPVRSLKCYCDSREVDSTYVSRVSFALCNVRSYTMYRTKLLNI